MIACTIAIVAANPADARAAPASGPRSQPAGSHEDATKNGMANEGGEVPGLRERMFYACPTHTDVHEEVEGSCPQCGAFLVPVHPAASPDALR